MLVALQRAMTKLLLLALVLGACATDAVENSDTLAEEISTTPDDVTALAAAPRPRSAALGSGQCPAPTLLPVTGQAGLGVVGDPGSAAGIFDASVVYPSGAPGGAMAYSSVPDQHSIRTRIALSATAGASYTYVAEVNTPELALLTSSDPAECPGGFCLGYLISEVSSLIFDATDPNPATRWKLYAHRYLAEANNRLHYRLGTIVVQTAAAPQGPWTAPRKVFGLPSPSPYTTSGAQVDASRLAGMADCIALSEPSALWRPERIDLAMGCVYLAGTTPKIRIVRVRTLDHGRTWVGLGTVMVPGDADCLPGTTPGASVNAADLFLGPDGVEYMSATSSDPLYHGCAVYKVANPLTGQIERTASGAPRVVRTIAADTGQFAGACTFSTGGGGYLMSVGFLDSSRPFRLFYAGVTAP